MVKSKIWVGQTSNKKPNCHKYTEPIKAQPTILDNQTYIDNGYSNSMDFFHSHLIDSKEN